jgi:hypothetical protein
MRNRVSLLRETIRSRSLAVMAEGKKNSVFYAKGLFILVDGIYRVLCLGFTQFSNLRKAFCSLFDFHLVDFVSLTFFFLSLGLQPRWCRILNTKKVVCFIYFTETPFLHEMKVFYKISSH